MSDFQTEDRDNACRSRAQDAPQTTQLAETSIQTPHAPALHYVITRTAAVRYVLQVFAFAATVVYGVDTFLQFRDWRSNRSFTPHTTTTTTTTSAGLSSGPAAPTDVKVQY